MRRVLAALFSVAVVVVASGALAGPPLGGPVNPPRTNPPPIGTGAHIALPPPNNAAWLKTISIKRPGTTATNTWPGLIRPDGPCFAGRECILYGRNLGKQNSLNGSGYKLVVTAPPATAPIGVLVTAWNDNLIAFTGLPRAGTYLVSIEPNGGKTVTSLTLQAAAPPANGNVDMDHDGAIAAPYGNDCDDSDPHRFPGNQEVGDNLDHDEDCNPATFGATDRDGDHHIDGALCNVAMTGTGMDRHFTYTCGDDCDDNQAIIYPGQMECDPGTTGDRTMIALCATGATGLATWSEISCSYYAGPTGHCINQPNGTGICVP